MIPLARAYLCLDCETLSAPATICFACASRSVVPLATFLTRQPGLIYAGRLHTKAAEGSGASTA